MKNPKLPFLALFSSLLIVIICASIMLASILDFSGGYVQTRAAQIKESIISSVAQCYALEGRYPDDLSYLEVHYGLQLDRADYTIHYELFASNIFPGIRVIAKG